MPADAIYRTRKNRDCCQERGIRLSGKPPGRPRKETEENKEALKAQRKQRREDETARIPVEGKFGNAKRKGPLDRIMARLIRTSESVIHIGFIVLNLDKRLRQVLFWLQPAGLGGLRVLLRIGQTHPIMELPPRDRPFAPPSTL